VPILVGGTGLYFKALTEGLAAIPDMPPDIRKHWRERAEAQGPEQLHRELAARDPAMAARLRPTDPQRIARALEPLAQIANVRRLGDEELRAAAKAILDNRSTRLGSRTSAPRELSRTARNQALGLGDDEPLSTTLRDDDADLGSNESQRIPDPAPLPLTDEPAAY
jgi:hypothetical protein